MEAAMNQVESSGSQQETQSRRDSIKDNRVWNAKRDQICQAMWPNYTRNNGDIAEFVADNVEEGVVDKGRNALKEISVALKEINRGPVDYIALYSEVMAMMVDGYSEDMLAIAFDHLCENKKAARGFLAKNAKLRKLWMDNFLCTHL
nr:hypothetical protein CFP56_31983 [Quercus suber]